MLSVEKEIASYCAEQDAKHGKSKQKSEVPWQANSRLALRTPTEKNHQASPFGTAPSVQKPKMLPKEPT